MRYFTHHGVDRIYDVDTAKAEGYIPEDYWVWWGMEGDYLRHVYNCFVNAAVQPADGAEKSRDFLPFDMFPTVLASIGCEIEGDRLGLGTNLFSGAPTLYEKYGYAYLDAELSKSSTDYDRRFLWGLGGE